MWKNMGMANLPAVTQPEKPVKALRPAQKWAILRLAKGANVNSICEGLSARYGKHPDQWRWKMLKWASKDELFQQEIAALAHGSLILDTLRVAKAVGNRAARGNPNMARLALEATGFHNPKVDHKHSGEVKITVSGLPRPTAGPDETPPVDAEVVEE